MPVTAQAYRHFEYPRIDTGISFLLGRWLPWYSLRLISVRGAQYLPGFIDSDSICYFEFQITLLLIIRMSDPPERSSDDYLILQLYAFTGIFMDPSFCIAHCFGSRFPSRSHCSRLLSYRRFVSLGQHVINQLNASGE